MLRTTRRAALSATLLLAFIALLGTTAHADGQPQIDRYAVGGSERVSFGGGEYTLVSTVGSLGEAMQSSGGEYTVFGGFWSAGQGNFLSPALVPGLTAVRLWLLAAVLAAAVLRSVRRARVT